MITYQTNKSTFVIPLGRQGENNARQIVIRSFGLSGGEYVLLHQRSGDTQPYPVAVTTEDDNIVWTVTSADVAMAGTGKCELQYLEDDVVIKSKIWKTKVQAALEEAGDAPDPETGWVAAMMDKIESILAEQGNTGSGLPDASEAEDGTILVTQNGQWILLHMGLDDITEEEF